MSLILKESQIQDISTVLPRFRASGVLYVLLQNLGALLTPQIDVGRSYLGTGLQGGSFDKEESWGVWSADTTIIFLTQRRGAGEMTPEL